MTTNQTEDGPSIAQMEAGSQALSDCGLGGTRESLMATADSVYRAMRQAVEPQPAALCRLGCMEECKARLHGCPSECPAPAAAPQVRAAQPAGDAAMLAGVPLGAIENGRAYAECLERDYKFECEVGSLPYCDTWREFRRCFEALADWCAGQSNAQAAKDAEIAELKAMLSAAEDGGDLLQKDLEAKGARISALEADVREHYDRRQAMRTEWAAEVAALTAKLLHAEESTKSVAEMAHTRIAALTAQARHAEDVADAAKERIEKLDTALQAAINSNCDKIMAMSDEQVTALTRLDGSNPDDVARLGRQAFELARQKVRIASLEAELTLASETLRRYQALHEAKGTPDSAQKADANRVLAERFERILGIAS